MDKLEGIMRPEVHEKCMSASGSLVVWVGATDTWEEGTWASPITRYNYKYENPDIYFDYELAFFTTGCHIQFCQIFPIFFQKSPRIPWSLGCRST